MTDGMDWMDVQAEAERVAREERYSRIRHVESVEKDLRVEFRREVMELREEVGELVAEVHQALQREKELRDEGDAAVFRMVNARTEDLA